MSDDLSLDSLPENTQEYIRELRKEAARYRTERNELNTKYTEAGNLLAEANKRLDEFSAMETRLEEETNKNLGLSTKYDKLRAAAKFGIPEEVDRLQGSTYEEWETDAESLSAKLKTGKTVLPKDPAAGDKPSDPSATDPLVKAFRDAGYV